MKDDSYFVIYGWMINKLELKGTALQIYAIIYSFSKDGGECEGGLTYLSEAIGCTKQTVMNALSRLEKSGYITKNQVRAHDGGLRNHYKINSEILKNSEINPQNNCGENVENKADKPKNFTHKSKNFECPQSKNFNAPGQKIRPSNIYENNKLSISEGTRPECKIYGEFKNVRLLQSEYEKLKSKYGVQLEQTLFSLSAYMASTGKKYTNHYAVLCKWCREDLAKKSYKYKEAEPSYNLEDYKSLVNTFRI